MQVRAGRSASGDTGLHRASGAGAPGVPANQRPGGGWLMRLIMNCAEHRHQRPVNGVGTVIMAVNNHWLDLGLAGNGGSAQVRREYMTGIGNWGYEYEG